VLKRLFLFAQIVIYMISFSLEIEIPSMPTSIIVADFDNDTDNDIILGHHVNWGNNDPRLTFIENEDGFFSLVDTSISFCGGYDLCTINLNNDLIIDFVAIAGDLSGEELLMYARTFYNDNNFIFEFEDYLLEYNFVHNRAAGGYINNDNFEDLVYSSYDNNFWCYLFNNGESFYESGYFFEDFLVSEIECEDLNGDNLADIIIGGSNTVIYFSTDTEFDRVIINENHPVHNIRIIDFDNDGQRDIIGTNNIMGIVSPLYIYQNQGNCEFSFIDTILVSPGLSNISLLDMNQDNLFDIVGFNTNGLYIYFNEGDNIFSDPDFYHIPDMMQLHYPLWCGDLDGNSTPDIAITANGYFMSFYNDGFGNLSVEPHNNVTDQTIQNNVSFNCFPNPFNPETSIKFNLLFDSQIELTIYNIKGSKVIDLINDKYPKGAYTTIWDGNDGNGRKVSSGVYFCRLITENRNYSKKVVLLK
jgi:type IX secretion system substrate protein/VCBS repeat protein